MSSDSWLLCSSDYLIQYPNESPRSYFVTQDESQSLRVAQTVFCFVCFTHGILNASITMSQVLVWHWQDQKWTMEPVSWPYLLNGAKAVKDSKHVKWVILWSSQSCWEMQHSAPLQWYLTGYDLCIGNNPPAPVMETIWLVEEHSIKTVNFY